jgi:hypothetical protein
MKGFMKENFISEKTGENKLCFKFSIQTAM